MIKAIILDSDLTSTNSIAKLIESVEDIIVIDIFSDPVKAFNSIINNSIDLLIIEPNIKNLNGFDFIGSLESNIDVIIVSKQTEYAIEAFELEVLDFIVKPIETARFLKSISRVIKKRSSSQKEERTSIYLKVDKKMIKIYHDQILFVEAVGDYIKVVCKEDTFISNNTLKSFTSQLPENDFIRIHRSYTISLKRVTALEGNQVEIGKHKIPIGRQYLASAKTSIIS